MWRSRSPAISTAILGLALASVAMVAIIPLVNVLSVSVLAHYASPEKQSVRAIVMTVVRNPLIWACVIGLAINLSASAAAARSGTRSPTRSAAPRWRSACWSPAPACTSKDCSARALAAASTVFLKLVLMPVLAIALALWFGVSGSNLVIVACCSAVPTSSSAYVLARQMGGDAPLLAQIITLQTILAAITMPIAIALVA